MAEKEYIEREAVLDLLKNRDVVINPHDEVANIREDVECLPAADVRPVVRGHWCDTSNYYQRWKCSVCGSHTRDARPPFCPNCGADMREES